MRILYVTTIGTTMNFFKDFIKYLVDSGNSVDIATNSLISPVPDIYEILNCNINQINASRSPFSKNNITAYKQLKELIDTGNYDIIHCHTPIASMLTRLAARMARKKGTRVIYTAHGFHFYKGAPLLNWLIYFPVEWICSFFTDTLITINTEDYEFAKKWLHPKETKYIHGVGIDIEKFSETKNNKKEIFEELNIPENSRVLFSIGELNKNKNHQAVIKALAQTKDENLYYLVAGTGESEHQLLQLAKELNITERVRLLGYRKDIAALLQACDIFIFPSYREGLPVSVMEAMAAGLPVIASDIRGVKDLIKDHKGGFLCNPDAINCFEEKIKLLLGDKTLCNDFAGYNKEKIESYSKTNVIREMSEIYKII